MRRPNALRPYALAGGLGLALFVSVGAGEAQADATKVEASLTTDASTVAPTTRARWHPTYAVELEAHGTVAGFDQFAAGLGGGLRATVPLLEQWPFRRIDNGLAVGIGFDAVRYGAYRPTDSQREVSRVVMAYYVPVYAQWNWWTGRVVSAFVEAGLLYRHASYVSDCPESICAERSRVMPVGYIGGRFRLADHVALTLRVGWPMFTLGASWL